MHTKMEYPNYKLYEMDLAGRKLSIETGKLGGLSNASCMVRYGETAVLVNVTASEKPRAGIDFFPLSVDFEEKLYAVGRIPGSFMRREARPGDKAILSSRVIDRPIRPLFPKDMRNDVVVSALIMSVDQDCEPEVAALIGVSCALSISNIPWDGPLGGVHVGWVDGRPVLNPTSDERKESALALTIAASEKKVVMIEARGNEVPEKDMLEAIRFAHDACKDVCKFINDIVAEIGKPKTDYTHIEIDHDFFEEFSGAFIEKMRYCMDTDDKNVREERLSALRREIEEKFPSIAEENPAAIEEAIYKLQKFIVRRWLLDEGKRVDGRGMYDMRPLGAEVGLLPRTHGSGLFTRGQTQVLTVATLGTIGDNQLLDDIYEDETKRYMHHYNFPSWSVGEARSSRSPGRREIGHGALAEKALEPVLPSLEEFPYTIRLVSEVLSSNGSTSQGSICGSTLALMDAGVPIKAPVAGISCGLVTEGDRWITFTDIQGVEDFYGDMDFKVAGTNKGITAIQMDLKIDGLTDDIIVSALELTRDARMVILDEVMIPCIAEPRKEVSKYAPKMLHIMIDPDKIREVIGKGGSVIQKIVADTGAKIDIEDDGSVYISSPSAESCDNALKTIQAIVRDVQVGDTFYGRVTRIMAFGAFVEFAPGKEGMVHISKLENFRVNKIEDVLNIGDMTWVKIIEIDDKGRINLSRKDAIAEVEAKGGQV